MIGLLFASGASGSSSSPSNSHGNHATKWHLVTRLLGLPHDAVLDKPLARFGHFLFLFFRLQKLTRIPYRHRPRKAMHMFDSTLSMAIRSAGSSITRRMK